MFDKRSAGVSKSRFDENMRIHLLYAPDPEDRCVFSSKDCCVSNSKDCSPKKIVEDFYSFFSRNIEDPISRGPGFQTHIWECASDLEHYIECSLSSKQTSNAYHIIIPLIDLEMYNKDTYQDVVCSLIRKEKGNLDRLYTIPLILSEKARGFLASNDTKQAALIRKDKDRILSLKKQRLIIASMIIKKLLWRSSYDKSKEKEKLTIFLSYTTKKDKANSQEKKVDNFKKFIEETLNPVYVFRDADSISLGEDFWEKVKSKLTGDTLMFVFLNDHYSSRFWCQKEVIIAKDMCNPVVVIDSIERTGKRIFPYLGNSPFFSYSTHDSENQDNSKLLFIIEKCMKVWLKHVYHRRKIKQSLSNMTLKKKKKEEVIQFPQVPELLTVSKLNIDDGMKGIIVYPDPPVGTTELKVLKRIKKFTYLSLTQALGSSKFE